MKNIGIVITVLTIFASIVGGWFTLQADAKNIKEKQTATDARVGKLEDTSIETGKAIVKQTSDIEHIKGDVSKMSTTLEAILIEVKKKR